MHSYVAAIHFMSPILGRLLFLPGTCSAYKNQPRFRHYFITKSCDMPSSECVCGQLKFLKSFHDKLKENGIGMEWQVDCITCIYGAIGVIDYTVYIRQNFLSDLFLNFGWCGHLSNEHTVISFQ